MSPAGGSSFDADASGELEELEPEPDDIEVEFDVGGAAPEDAAAAGAVADEHWEDHIRAPGPFAEIPVQSEPEEAAESGPTPEPAPEPAAEPEDAGEIDVNGGDEVFGSPEAWPPPPKESEKQAEEIRWEPELAEVPEGGREPRTPGDDEELIEVDEPAVFEPAATQRISHPIGPFQVDDSDPFGDIGGEETSAAAVAEVEVEDAPSPITPRADAIITPDDNQLHVRLQGTGAIAESGQVRALDIEVPVPGSWVGNRRVTLQLRLTLSPAPEDEHDEES